MRFSPQRHRELPFSVLSVLPVFSVVKPSVFEGRNFTTESTEDTEKTNTPSSVPLW
jgi:hypothetical protein